MRRFIETITLTATLLGSLATGASAQNAARYTQTVQTAQSAAARASAAGAAVAQQAPTTYGGDMAEVHQGSVAYRWTRGGMSIDLVNRDGAWTADEASRTRDALALLPDVYVRKAVAGGLKKLIRDGEHPQVPLNALFGSNDAAAITVVQWPFNYVTLGNNVFQYDFEWTYEVITHELGHCVDWHQTSLSFTSSEFSHFSWTPGAAITQCGLLSWNGFVTDYARTNPWEDFAESCAYYWIDPTQLAAANPAKLSYIRNTIFEGLESPAEARFTGAKNAPGWIVPNLTSVGDGSASNYAIVGVHGQHFMGTFDGGYNTVRFRGQRAVHIPVTRQLIYATVPGIDGGGAPVTVTTEDGTSNPVAFNVNKPWWKFW